ncbi:MAG: PilW family protein [Myxococcota bacterium]
MVKRASASARRARGFTLVELLVALTGGLFVSIAVFAMARDATRFYQREGRLANATLATVVGFERLRADVARAGFLATPNIQADPLVCNRPAAGAPTRLLNLASVWVGTGANGSPSNSVVDSYLDSAPGKRAHALILAGSYSSPDEFPVRLIAPLGTDGSDGFGVYLQLGSGALARLGWAGATTESAKTLLLSQLFAAGRVLRLVDKEGRAQYGTIASVSVDAANGEPFIKLNATPALVFRYGQSRLCGFKGNETGASANVVNFIRYDLRNLKSASLFSGTTKYADLYTTSTNTVLDAFEKNRTELVRTELDASDKPLSVNSVNLEELVAEYAVDFRLGIGAVNSNPSTEPTLVQLDEGDNGYQTYTDAPSAGGMPQRLRSLRVRLSVRSREGDRDERSFAGGLYRVGLGANGKGPYARVRTLQADVMLNNNANVQTW